MGRCLGRDVWTHLALTMPTELRDLPAWWTPRAPAQGPDFPAATATASTDELV